jgi:hypothetical protein
MIRLLLAGVAVLALAGCREDEQARAIHADKGVYQGPDMPALDDDTREALRERAQNQNF